MYPAVQNTEKFTGFAVNYQNRPDYPVELADLLKRELGVLPGSSVADVGAGTGILSRLLLDAGYRVFAVEPNADMRSAMKGNLSGYAKLTMVDAPAEKIPLADQSVDLVTVGQALHLFDLSRARNEFIRILRGKAQVVLVWNFGDLASELHKDYLKGLAEYGANPRPYDEKTAGKVPSAHLELVKTFLGENYGFRILEHHKRFSVGEYLAYCFSSPELPRAGHPRYEAAVNGVHALFARHQKDGFLDMEYHARVYWGFLK